MSKRILNICLILMGIGVLTVFLNWRITVGFEVGSVIAILLFIRNDRYWNDVVDMGESHMGKGILHFLVNYGLMAVVLLLGAFYPQYINIFSAAVGLTLVKIAIILNELVPRKEGVE